MKNCMFGLVLGVLISALSFYVTVYKDLVSIEYTEHCFCGSQMECYKSFVDGYETKECKECGYGEINGGDNND